MHLCMPGYLALPNSCALPLFVTPCTCHSPLPRLPHVHGPLARDGRPHGDGLAAGGRGARRHAAALVKHVLIDGRPDLAHLRRRAACAQPSCPLATPPFPPLTCAPACAVLLIPDVRVACPLCSTSRLPPFHFSTHRRRLHLGYASSARAASRPRSVCLPRPHAGERRSR